MKVKRIHNPRFPNHSLHESIEQISLLHNHAGRRALPADMLVKVFGFSSLNGTSRTLLASLGHYGLLKREGSTHRVSSIALRIIRPTDEGDRIQAIKEAQSSPKLFAMITQKHSDVSDSVLPNVLMHEDPRFSEGGAKKAVKICKENLEYIESICPHGMSGAKNGENASEDENALEESIHTTEKRQQTRNFNPPMTHDFLTIPIGPQAAQIPIGMSEDDFQLLLDSLKLWKRRIVADLQQRPSDQG